MSVGGFATCFLLAAVFEFSKYKNTQWEVYALFVPFALSQQIVFFLVVFIIQRTQAATYNISNLGTNLYTFAASLLIFRVKL